MGQSCGGTDDGLVVDMLLSTDNHDEKITKYVVSWLTRPGFAGE